MMRCLISFSGGETSAYMTWWMLQNKKPGDEYLVVFANTGQENDETLNFVHKCDKQLFTPLGHPVVWIEAVMQPKGKAPTHKVVTFETADRDGHDLSSAPLPGLTVFEAAIKKYGIPNSKFKDCTRNLKRNPIESYARSRGWKNGEYKTAIGIRADEIDRVPNEIGR